MSFFKFKASITEAEGGSKVEGESKTNDFFISGNLTHDRITFETGSDSLNRFASISSDYFPFEIKGIFNKDETENEETPEKIKEIQIKYDENKNSLQGQYQDLKSINIETIHAILSKVTQTRPSLRSEIEKKINEIDFKLEQPLTIVEKKILSRDKDKLNSELELVKNNTAYEEYKLITEPLIKQYKNVKLSKNSDEELEDLIESYLKIISRYVEVNLINLGRKDNLCIGCKQILNQTTSCGELIICSKCGCENHSFNKLISENDKIKLSIGKKTKKNEENFEDGYRRFMAKKNIKIPENFEEKLDAYFQHIKFPTGKEIRKKELIKDGMKKIRKGTSIDKMIEALEKCNLSEYYKHVRYICQVYWGWELTDISKYREEIFLRYRVTSIIYNKIKKKSSSLNTDFHLLKILQSIGLKCKRNDFKKVKGVNTMKEYEEYWKQIMNEIKTKEEYHIFEGVKIDW